MRDRSMRLALVLALSLLIAGCSRIAASPSAPDSSPAPSPTPAASPAPSASGTDPMQERARSVLAAWAAKVNGTASTAPVLLGEMTGQIGDWEEAVGENNKVALMAGAVMAAEPMPDTPGGPGEIRWADGSTQQVTVQSAADAFAGIVADGAGGCGGGCRPVVQPLVLEPPTLGSITVMTSKGQATAPAWLFAVRGSAVVVTRVAVADRVTLPTQTSDIGGSSAGPSIDGAIGVPTDASIVVWFVGAPGPATDPCGADYTAEAVESELAIAVIVREHRASETDGASGTDGVVACPAIGARRTATVSLAAPLGDRVVLGLRDGLPVPVTPN